MLKFLFWGSYGSRIRSLTPPRTAQKRATLLTLQKGTNRKMGNSARHAPERTNARPVHRHAATITQEYTTRTSAKQNPLAQQHEYNRAHPQLHNSTEHAPAQTRINLHDSTHQRGHPVRRHAPAFAQQTSTEDSALPAQSGSSRDETLIGKWENP